MNSSVAELEINKIYIVGLCHSVFVCSDHDNDRVQTMVYLIYAKLSRAFSVTVMYEAKCLSYYRQLMYVLSCSFEFAAK